MQHIRRVTMFNVNMETMIMEFKSQDEMDAISNTWKEKPSDWKVKEVEPKKIETPEVITTSPFQCPSCKFIGKNDMSIRTHIRFAHKGKL